MNAPSVAKRSSEAPDPRVATVRRIVFVTVFLDLLGFGIIIPLLPFYVQSMGGSASTIGVLLSCFAFAQLLATPILGRISDRVGRRRVILLSLIGNALSMVLFAFATKVALLPLLFASRVLAGATAGNIAACQAAIADVSEGAERAKGMGHLGAGIGLGMVFGPILGGILSQLGGWAPPLGAAVMAAVDLLAAHFWMPETRTPLAGQASETSKSETIWKVFRVRFVIVLGMYFCVFLGITTLQVALALVTKLRFGWGEVEVGRVFGMFGVVMLIVQGLLPNWLGRTFGEGRVVTTGTLVTAGGLLAVALAHYSVPMLLGLILMAVGLGLTQPFLASIAAQHVGKRHYGAALGLAQSAGGLARVVGPVLGGVVYERLSPAAPFIGGACAALLATVLSLSLQLLSKPTHETA